MGDEAAEGGVVGEDGLAVQGEGALTIGVGEESLCGSTASFGEHLAGVFRIERAGVAVRRQLFDLFTRHVPRRMTAARVDDDEEAVVLVAIEPVDDVVEDRRCRPLFARRVGDEGFPAARETEGGARRRDSP